MAAFSAAALRTKGFAFVHAPDVAAACEAAVAAWSQRDSFRYPAGHYDVEVDAHYRAAFNAMHSLAASCLQRACRDEPAAGCSFPSESPPPFDLSERGGAALAEPFSGVSGAPYAASFASIFNFDFGFLNAHRDRGLLTAVWGRPRALEPPGARVRLLCRRLDSGGWVDLCEEAPAGSLALIAGEQLQAASRGHFRAAEHSCRVDPDGARLDTRLPADPAAAPCGNRHSMAHVLCATHL